MKLDYAGNTIRNAFWGIIYRIVTLLGPFVVKTLLVYKLGVEYSGLSSLFTSILTVLNLTNMGFNSAIVFTMYKAIVDDDIDAQCAMVKLYRKAYRIVGGVILGLGIVVMPFLPYLVEGGCPPDINIYILFSIYLAETAFDYFIFPYNAAIFSAYQRNDITLKISTVRYSIQYILQAFALIIFRNYYVYIILAVIMVIPNNIVNHIVSKKAYPLIECRGEVSNEIKKDIKTRVATLFGHKLGNTMLVSIDSIIISAYLGLTVMGVYANYYYILTAVNALVEVITNGAISGIGNKLFIDSEEDNYSLFKTMTYMWLFIIGGSAACMLCLYQPFIAGIWYSSEFLLNENIVILIVVYFYSWMFRIMQLTYRDAAGLWVKDWLKPYVAMAINVFGSIYLVKMTHSIAGALIPTIFVFWVIYFPWEAYVLFRHLFHKGLKKYLVKMVSYTLIAAVGVTAAYSLCIVCAPDATAINFFIRLPIAIIVYCVIWGILTHRCSEYSAGKKKIIELLRRS